MISSKEPWDWFLQVIWELTQQGARNTQDGAMAKSVA